MTTPRIALATLALNEAEWLDRLYEQHRDWPGLVAWSFVEFADPCYAAANPDRVNEYGLSVDLTTDILTALQRKDDRVWYSAPDVKSGPATDAAQGQCYARTWGLRDLDAARPDFVFVLDADEFYTKAHQREITETMADPANAGYTAFGFGLRSIWRPPGIAHEPLMRFEARGGVWSVPICRGWRWSPGMEYRANHNSPQVGDVSLATRMLKRWGPVGRVPECVHMGFTASPVNRAAKHRYYEARGEGKETVGKNRAEYVACRRAWETWRPGGRLPPRCGVVEYTGPIPEVFR